MGGGFDSTTTDLPTMGAMDVKIADLDGDTDLDIVFANYWDNSKNCEVDSMVYLNDGSGGFGRNPDVRLPTTGAVAVTVADIDEIGWKDLVFACKNDGTTFKVASPIYLGGTSGWSTTPDIELPTEGATDVVVAHLIKYGWGGYMSQAITPENPGNTGTFHTLRYTANLGPSQSGRLQLVDADTWEVLAEIQLTSGSNEWVVEDLFKVKAHPSIRIVTILSGLETGGTFDLDDLWLNWTKRVKRPPEVLDIGVSSPSVYRTNSVDLWVNVSDEYDLVSELVLTLEHRLNGTSGSWEWFLMGSMKAQEGGFRTTISPKTGTPTGWYEFRARVMDTDVMYSEWISFSNVLEILNNPPSAPEVRITPLDAVTTSTLNAEIMAKATDIENPDLQYRYLWYRDGELEANATQDSLAALYTSKDQNWSVEVRAFDGEDTGPQGLAWLVIGNSRPVIKDDLPDPEFDEDTTDDQWLNLVSAFEDHDGDVLTWSISEQPTNLTVTIDQAKGKVTLEPAPDWFGQEVITFLATDGEYTAQQTVTVRVLSVNDIPTFATVDGETVTTDTIEYTVKQGELLEIRYTFADLEGDVVQAEVNSSVVQLDKIARLITFQGDNEAVGTLYFGLIINDVESPGTKVVLNFVIVVENVNDPLEAPHITNPMEGASYRVNQTFSLIGTCDDPDIQYGQVLDYSWSSNISGHLGYGSTLAVKLLDAGMHLITLTVGDGEFEKTDTIEVLIKPRDDGPPPDGPDDDDETKGLNLFLVAGIMVVLVVVGAVLFLVMGKRRAEEPEEEMEAEEEEEAIEDKEEAIREAVDSYEASLDGYQTTPEEPRPEIEVEGTVRIPSTTLTMEASKTETASEDVSKLWEGISGAEETSEEEKEALRLDNLKRKYQNAIGRLPYGIPSKELDSWEWIDLASALAAGEKKTLPDGRETTEIESRWYYSDPDDSSTFLKEHGAKPKKEEPKKEEVAEPSADKTKLLAKLEERFIMGEISEDSYNELKKKYRG
jgi:uncharacterized membrane protein